MAKVIVVFPGNERGGAATHLLTYANAIHNAGLSSEVLFLSIGNGPLWGSIHDILPSTTAIEGNLQTQVKGLRHAMVSAGDVLWHAHGPRVNVMVYQSAHKTRQKWTSTIHSHPYKDFLGSRIKSTVFTRLNLFSLKRTIGVFVGNRLFAEFVPGKPAFYVPNAIQSNPNSVNRTVDRDEFRTRHRIPSGATVLGIAARFDRVKDIPTAIRAFAKLHQRTQGRQSLHFVIAGDGEQSVQLHDMVRTLSISDFVHFVGFLNDVHPFYNAIDAHILPSKSEGESPFVILEAGAHDVANVGADISGIRNLIEDEQTGLLFPVGDVDHLVLQLQRVLDPRMREHLTTGFRKRVLPRFSSEAMLEAYLSGYREMGWSI